MKRVAGVAIILAMIGVVGGYALKLIKGEK